MMLICLVLCYALFYGQKRHFGANFFFENYRNGADLKQITKVGKSLQSDIT